LPGYYCWGLLVSTGSPWGLVEGSDRVQRGRNV